MIDQIEQIGALGDDIPGAVLNIVLALAPPESLGKTEDNGKRCAKFMCNIGKNAIFKRIKFFEAFRFLLFELEYMLLAEAFFAETDKTSGGFGSQEYI